MKSNLFAHADGKSAFQFIRRFLVDGDDVQLFVGASAPDVFSSVESESATQQMIQEMLEAMDLPKNREELTALLNEAMMSETISPQLANDLLVALGVSEIHLVPPAELSMPKSVSTDASKDPVQQETVEATPTTQQETQDSRAMSEVRDMQFKQEDQVDHDVQGNEASLVLQGHEMEDNRTVGLSAEDLAEALGKLPGMDSSSRTQNVPADGVSLQSCDLKGINLLNDVDPRSLENLGLTDVEIEIISTLQSKQALGQEIELLGNDNSPSHATGDQNLRGKTKAAEEVAIQPGSSSARGSTQQLGSVEVHKSCPWPVEQGQQNKPQPEGAPMNGVTDGHMGEGTAYSQELQVSAAYGPSNSNVLDGSNEGKLVELQNALQRFGGDAVFDLLSGIKGQPNLVIGTAESATEIFSTQWTPNLDSQSVGVNVDQIPQEVVSVSIERLLDTRNIDMSSLSQDTREQLMWLVTHMSQSQRQQVEYANGEDEDDEDKRQAKIREENRERKKRWRESNQDRNKDNDLRCRVSKRATRLYGPAETDEKKKWMEVEFSKRKEKREAKERARFHDDRISASTCFGSYQRPHHYQSGGSSTTFHSAQTLANRELDNPAELYEGAFRERANSVAESTTSSINDGDGTDSDRALKILSDPEAAQKLLQNSEAMQLLSNNPEALSFLQSVVESKKYILPLEGTNEGEPLTQVASNTATTISNAMPDATPSLSDQQPHSHLSIDISAYLELSEEELMEKLTSVDSDTAEKILTELAQRGAEEEDVLEAMLEATGPSTTPVEMDLDPDVQRILDAVGDHHHDVGLDLSLVNDKLINFSTEDFSLSDDVSHDNGNTDMGTMMDLGPEPSDISTKLFQALQGVLSHHSSKQWNSPILPVLPASPPPPTPPQSTPRATGYNRKRVAPTTAESSPSSKRHQSSPVKSSLELSPDAAQVIASLLQHSGIDLQRLGVTPTCPQTPPLRTNSVPRASPSTTNQTSNTYNVPSASPRLNISRPLVTTSNNKPISTAAAHAASFGNSAAMNQRLMPPPAYRPSNLGIGYGGFGSMSTIPKKKPDERIVKAMGFPPMMAGMKRKTAS